MPPAEIIAHTDEIHARLEHGEFAGLGPIAVEGGKFLPDAEVAARILLADVEHWTELEQRDQASLAPWGHLAAQLGDFLHEVEHLRVAQVGGLESRFELALRRSPIVVYRQDTELRYTWVYNPHPDFVPETVGKSDAELLHPDEFERIRDIKRRVMDTGVGTRETVLVSVSGTPTYFDLTVEPLYDARGAIIGVTGASADITALMHTEQALARREAQLNEAQRIAHIGSWEWDVVTEQLSWSAEQYRIFGCDPEAGVPSLPAAQARIHPDDRDRVMQLMQQTLVTGEPYAADFRLVHLDGAERVIYGHGMVVRDAAGRVERLIGTSQDITERVQAEAARAAERQRQARLDGMIFAARQRADQMCHRLEQSRGGAEASARDWALCEEMRAVLDASMQDLLDLRRLVGDAPSSDGDEFQAEASERTPEA